MIPKIIHQIWVGDFKIPKREKMFVDRMKEMNTSFEHIFWTSAPKLPNHVQYVYDTFYEKQHYAFCADILRLWVVNEYGGIYLDVDYEPKNPLNDFVDYDGVFFHHHEEDKTIPNGTFGGKKQLDILEFCLDNVTHTNTLWYGPGWFSKTIKKFVNVDYESPHNQVKKVLKEKNIEYFSYETFENQYAKHHALYSWSSEMWVRFNNREEL